MAKTTPVDLSPRPVYMTCHAWLCIDTCTAGPDHCTAQLMCMEISGSCRRPLGGGVVELRHGPQAEHVTRYLQVSHSLQPSVPRLDVQLDQTSVSLAFNLQGELPSQQQVYAFLPLRSYGLTFIVQVRHAMTSAMCMVCWELCSQMAHGSSLWSGQMLPGLQQGCAFPPPWKLRSDLCCTGRTIDDASFSESAGSKWEQLSAAGSCPEAGVFLHETTTGKACA